MKAQTSPNGNLNIYRKNNIGPTTRECTLRLPPDSPRRELSLSIKTSTAGVLVEHPRTSEEAIHRIGGSQGFLTNCKLFFESGLDFSEEGPFLFDSGKQTFHEPSRLQPKTRMIPRKSNTTHATSQTVRRATRATCEKVGLKYKTRWQKKPSGFKTSFVAF
ncbi:hypothetical protein BDZ94DRAFT_1270295 [Collybia nuda]|uniref:Uncharacterized protein n=1 Tax=Collybia nuda TaxID=64659 RepID=A0A9P6CAK5_9AGAR|nr:hypothetical protein BDZ94DRAFT_1270295 [Collybia nuda]